MNVIVKALDFSTLLRSARNDVRIYITSQKSPTKINPLGFQIVLVGFKVPLN